MIGKKYIFETARTRYKRYFLNATIILFISSLFYLIFSFYLLYYGSKQNILTEKAFYQKSPDLIAVFTGDIGRIPFAIDLSKKYFDTKVFITGVYEKNNVERLIRYTGNKEDPEVDSLKFQIDYLARNTVENVIATYRFLRERKEFKKIIIVSSDYHLYRIKQITETLKVEGDSFEVFYYGIETNLHSMRNIKIILKEVYKIFKAQAFLLLWETEYDLTNQN